MFGNTSIKLDKPDDLLKPGSLQKTSSVKGSRGKRMTLNKVGSLAPEDLGSMLEHHSTQDRASTKKLMMSKNVLGKKLSPNDLNLIYQTIMNRRNIEYTSRHVIKYYLCCRNRKKL